MALTMKCNVVSAERSLYEGEVQKGEQGLLLLHLLLELLLFLGFGSFDYDLVLVVLGILIIR